MNFIFIWFGVILLAIIVAPSFCRGLKSVSADHTVHLAPTFLFPTSVKIQLRNSSASASRWEFVCSLSEAQIKNNSFTLQSIRVESCDNEYNCKADLHAYKSCSAREKESCIYHKPDAPPVKENKLKVTGKVTCTVKINSKSYDSHDFYFRGLSLNYYLTSELPPLEERLALSVKKSESNVNQTEVSCTALYFFYRSASLTLTMIDRHRVGNIAQEVKGSENTDIRGWTHSFETLLTREIQSFVCSVHLHNSSQLVNTTYVVMGEGRPSTQNSALPTTETITSTTTTTETTTASTTTKETTPLQPKITMLNTSPIVSRLPTNPTMSPNIPPTTPQSTSTKDKPGQKPAPKTKIPTVSATNTPVVTKAMPLPDPSNQSFVTAVSSTMSLVFLGICLLVGYCRHRYFTIKWICCLAKSTSQLENYEMKPVRSVLKNFVIPPRYLISAKDLSVDYSQIVRQGQFSTLYQGHLKLNGKRSVVVKVNTIGGDAGQIVSLMNDVQMRILAGETNESIATLLGAYFDCTAGRVYIAMQSSPKRNMREFLTNQNMPMGQMKILNMPPHEMIDTFCTWLKGVSQGLEFLHSKMIVHGNLAAENILVCLQNTSSVSITGFSYSQQLIENSSYFVKSRSWTTGWETSGWRWMPIESLRYMEFSKESDVWSFGALMWEIFSLGAIPYSKFRYSNLSMEFIQKLEFGIRLPQPQLASKEIYRNMESCWSRYGKDRPKMNHLCGYFNQNQSNLVNYVNLAK